MSEAERKNAMAVMEALNHQNAKLEEFRQDIQRMGAMLQDLAQKYEALKQQQMAELVAKFGSGPTQR
jgi:prefoldin subunit 5